jgi:hypothetical protein
MPPADERPAVCRSLKVDFLSFTHLCVKTSTGRFWARRITIAKRMRAKLREVKE